MRPVLKLNCLLARSDVFYIFGLTDIGSEGQHLFLAECLRLAIASWAYCEDLFLVDVYYP